jgi:hypothetical protein
MRIDSVCNSVLLEACEDYVGLWSIVWEFREIFKETQNNVIQRDTMEVITKLLNNGFVYAGQFNSDGEFERWNSTPDVILTRIEVEWNNLGREPDMGEIVWFEATEKGEAVVKPT